MLEHLTDRALAAVLDARLSARSLRHGSVEPPHLLLGLLRSPDTTGARLLARAGVRHDMVRTWVEPQYEQSGGETATRIPLGAQVKQLLELAADEARRDGHALTATTHLALACGRASFLPALEPFVGGREMTMRLALESLRRPSARRGDMLRREALKRANEVRSQRAQLKRRPRLVR